MFNDVIYCGLIETTDPGEARYIRIEKVMFTGCRVTEGHIYKINRKFYMNEIFEDGEEYVIDDDGNDNFSVWTLCKKTYLK